MELVNETLLQSHMVRTQLAYKDLLQAIVVVKGSFDVLPSGETQPSARQPEVLLEDTQTPFGWLDAEVVPVKAWCDLAVLGHAHPPGATADGDRVAGGELARRMDVALRIGAFERRVRVSGDRVWVKALGRLVPSDPAPLAGPLPLTYEHAYGGFALQNGIEHIHHDNPFGKGHVLAKEHAAGTALPNIEEVDQLVESWSDQPTPAGFAPLGRAAAWRGRRGVEMSEDGKAVCVGPAAFCFAHPRMNVPDYPAGTPAELVGVTPAGGTWRFRMPAFAAWLRVDLGARHYQMPVVADTVYFLPDEQRVVVVGRCAFIYQFVPERPRVTRVMSAPDVTAYGATTTIRELRAAPNPEVPVMIEKPSFIDIDLDAMMRHHPLADLTDGLPLCASG